MLLLSLEEVNSGATGATVLVCSRTSSDLSLVGAHLQGNFSNPAFTLHHQFRKAHPSCFLPVGPSHSAAAADDGFSRGAASSRERAVPGLGSANREEAKKAAEAGLVRSRVSRRAVAECKDKQGGDE